VYPIQAVFYKQFLCPEKAIRQGIKNKKILLLPLFGLHLLDSIVDGPPGGLHVRAYNIYQKGGDNMNIRRTIGIALLALTLAPVYVAAQDMEMKATVVTKGEKDIKVKTKDDEKTILVGSKTKGLENAKEGSKVTIKYTEKDGQMRASEINPR
jgi:hypothetical protein